MKWYKHDPNAALAGMIGLTVEERGAYYTLIDLLYARDGEGVRDDLVCSALGCHGRTWNALKKQLIHKRKIWVREDGSLMDKRVENSLKESRNFIEKQTKRARKRWHPEENQDLTDAIARNASTTTTTYTTSFFPTAAREPAAPKKEVIRSSKASDTLAHIVRAKGWVEND